jgi:hypothetical protein
MARIDECEKWKRDFGKEVTKLQKVNIALEEESPNSHFLKPLNVVVTRCLQFIESVEKVKKELDANQKPDKKLTAKNKTIYASIFESLEKVEAINKEFTKDDELIGSEAKIPPILKSIHDWLAILYFDMCKEIADFIGPR